MEKFKQSNLKKLLIISQTTFSVPLFENIAQQIKTNISQEVELVIKNTICNTTSIRQKEAENISKKVDLMIVIGGKHSSNTKKLYEISQQNCKNVLLVQTVSNLEHQYLQRFERIGIIAGASTPQSIIDDIVFFCKN